MIAVIPPTNYEVTLNCGWAMLVFQTVGMVGNSLPRVVKLFIALIRLGIRLAKGRNPADKFFDVIVEAMKKDPNTLARKFGDRWMVKSLKKGLNGRQLKAEEKGYTVLPFHLTDMM